MRPSEPLGTHPQVSLLGIEPRHSGLQPDALPTELEREKDVTLSIIRASGAFVRLSVPFSHIFTSDGALPV